MAAWDDVNARVRGLSGHLLGEERLQRLAGVVDLRALARELAGTDYGPLLMSETPSAPELELVLRRAAAQRLALVARWAKHRQRALAVVFEDEDRRSLSALLRGAVGGVPAEHRLAGLIPTPSLPERALEELAAQPSAAGIAAMLVSWKHPYGAALHAEAAKSRPDLQRVENVLDRTYAQRARRQADGNEELRAFVSETIDIQNLLAVLVLAGSNAAAAANGFIDGGRHVSRELFAQAVGEPVPAAALLRLRRDVRDPVLGDALKRAEGAGGVERAALRARARAWRRRARVRPLSAAPVLSFVLRSRAEAMDLRAIAWRLTLGGARERFETVSP
jgi:V/A-type H+-transporting ATPase subunit C